MTNNLSIIKEGATKDLAVKLIMKGSESIRRVDFVLRLRQRFVGPVRRLTDAFISSRTATISRWGFRNFSFLLCSKLAHAKLLLSPCFVSKHHHGIISFIYFPLRLRQNIFSNNESINFCENILPKSLSLHHAFAHSLLHGISIIRHYTTFSIISQQVYVRELIVMF